MTDTLVWDDSGARYYETGVSKGILFPIDGSPGVPWNGLVAVNLDPQGGEHEAYYFDGIKYYDKVLSEDFQATIQTITTPKEFERCEGIRQFDGGAKASFNKRDKFHMVWRTEIGSDAGEAIGFKLHFAYNNLVQPSGTAYQTIADTVQMGTRSFVITSTPACGRNSYFWYDSREFDLTELEALLATGVLPMCWELKDYANPIGGGDGGGGGGSTDPDEGCDFLFENFESYVHGQTVDETKTVVDHETIIYGVINNGLDIIELPAGGAFAANDSAASEVGTSPTLTDDDDATYITSADGDLGYTVGLPPLVGYVEGCTLELHIRMSISGGVNPDDPDNMDADAQVHISTDAGGDDTIGGFSDGTDEGMGFALSTVDGTIVDYVVPLDMDAWVDTTIEDVVTALEAGAYLNVVGVSNNNTDTTPEVKVYEAKVVMLNDTDPDKWLRMVPDDELGTVQEKIFEPATTTPVTASLSVSVDFKAMQIAQNGDADGNTITAIQHIGGGTHPGYINVEADSGDLKFFWRANDFTTVYDSVDLEESLWYTAVLDWSWETIRLRVLNRETSEVVFDHTETLTISPTAQFVANVGMTGDSDVTYEIGVDNMNTQIHCNDEAPPAPITDYYIFKAKTGLPGVDSNGLENGSSLTGSSTQAALSDGSSGTYVALPQKSSFPPASHLMVVQEDLTADTWTDSWLEFDYVVVGGGSAEFNWELYVHNATGSSYHSVWNAPVTITGSGTLTQDLPLAGGSFDGESNPGVFTVANMVAKGALSNAVNDTIYMDLTVQNTSQGTIRITEVRLMVSRPG